MRTAFLSLVAGASGDMLLGALLDAGAPLEGLNAQLQGLAVPGCRVEVSQGRRGGVTGAHARVVVPEGHGATMGRLLDLLEQSALPGGAKERTRTVLERLRQAERLAHRTSPHAPESPLHELGSLDTLVDVAGVVLCLEALGVERLCASPLPLGTGVIATGHGPLPSSPPAVMALAALAGAAVTAPPPGATGELVTPTGAALVTVLAEFRQPAMALRAVGYGLGSREMPAIPNALAVWIGEEAHPVAAPIALLETNIDDSSPQLLGYAQERLFALGALDVWLTPVLMKKGRPGVVLSALVPLALEPQAVAILMRETPTLGVRRREVHRYEAQREVVEVETSLGLVPVKVKHLEGRPVAVAPEYEACRALALERGLPLREVMETVVREATPRLLGEPPPRGAPPAARG